MKLQVLAPGALTTVQDLGRHGWRHLGVGCAGAMDPDAMALANALVGNAEGVAVLELTLLGPTLALPGPTRIALTGADVSASFESPEGRISIPGGRPVALPAGTLRLGGLRRGNRAWLAFAGGIDVPPVLGSRSTDLRGGFGGHEGRALARGDSLFLGDASVACASTPVFPRWWVAPEQQALPNAPIRYVPSSHPAAPLLAGRAWKVSPNSNRQGTRLEGSPLVTAQDEQVSAAVAPGTIQLPPDGRPIVLLGDAQTVGGYPRLGHVIGADLARFAQRMPGSSVRFQPCTPATASTLWRAQRVQQQRLLRNLRARLAQ